MNLSLAARRLAVTTGMAVAILAAGGTILAASQWTAAEAPLAAAPVSIDSIQQALDQERARSAALEQQLAALEHASGDLSGALETAQGQLALDATTADDLRAALEAAQTKLTRLEAALQAAARAKAAMTVTTTTRATGGARTHDDDEDEHEHEHDDD